MRLAIVNLKGGVGKTTTAVYLAAGLAWHDRTLLVDADPQQSALAWSESAPDLPFRTISLPVCDLPRRLSELGRGYSHVVVDTPPGHEEIVRSAALAADHIIIPLPPGIMDMSRLMPTIELLAASTSAPVRLLLTQLRQGTKSAEAARGNLAALDLPILEAEIQLREWYRNSFGLVPTTLGDYKNVLAELMTQEVAA